MLDRRSFLQLTLVSATAAAMATTAALGGVDPGLLALMPPDATVMAGLSVDQAKASVYGLYMLGQMQVDDAGFQKFINDTGFDPRRDLSQILSATSGDATSSRTVLLGRGNFIPSKIATASQADGAKVTNYKGVDMIVHAGTDMTGALAFLDSTTAVLGQLDAVKSVIDRKGLTTPGLASSVVARITTLAGANDAWFLSITSPATFFAGKIDNPKVGPVLEAGMMQSVLAGSGGLKFSANGASITAQAVARSDKDATALADVVRFFTNIIQSNKTASAEAGQFASVLENMQVSTDGAYLNLLLNVPEATLEQMFMGSKKTGAAAAGRVAGVGAARLR